MKVTSTTNALDADVVIDSIVMVETRAGKWQIAETADGGLWLNCLSHKISIDPKSPHSMFVTLLRPL